MATEDAADIFDTGLCTLFAVPPIGFSTASPDEPHIYTPPGASGGAVRLWLPHPPASVHAALQANNLWLSAVFLADMIASGQITFSSSTPTLTPPVPAPSGPGPTVGARAPRVVELGAGAGLPSILAARTGARVTCTDYNDPVVVSTIRRNFAEQPGDWAVMGHSWGTDVSKLLARARGGYDAVLLADTLWSSDKHGILLDSVCSILRCPKGEGDDGGVVHVAAGLHTGRGPVARFLEMAETRGLAASFVSEVQWLPGGGWGAHEWAGERLQEERGVVVYYKLCWAR